MTRRSVRVAVHSLFSLVVTWPLVWYMDYSLPNGREIPGTVAFFNLWTLRWNQQQIGDLYRHYWDAPIFHPEPGAFALSEAQPLTGLVFAPISWITGNPSIGYNVIVLLALTLNGIAVARLCRRLGAGPWPAMLAGLLAQALPFVHNELGVEQLAMVFPVVFLVDAILRWSEEASWPRGLAIGAWLSATFLTCGYYGLFAIVIIGPAALVLVRREWFETRRLLQLGAALALFAVVCGPFLIGQARYTSNYARPERVIMANSAEPRAWVTLDQALPGSQLPWLNVEQGSEKLYPGTIPIGLAVFGLILILEGRTGGRERRRYVQAAFLGIAIALGILISLGLHLSVFGWKPYEVLRDHMPGFGDLRSPFRAAVFVQALLLPFAAIGLDWFWRGLRSIVPAPDARAQDDGEADAGVGGGEVAGVVTAGASGDRTAERVSLAKAADAPSAVAVLDGPPPPPDSPGADEDDGDGDAGDGGDESAPPAGALPTWRRRLGPALAVALTLVALAEVWPAPQELVQTPVENASTDWVAWLAGDHDHVAGDGSVAMYPFPPNGNYASYESTTIWMLAALSHGRPLVNGYSGLFPASYDQLEEAMRNGFPADQSMSWLERNRVSFVVVPRVWAEGDGRDQIEIWKGTLYPVFEGEDMVILAVTPRPTPEG